MDLLRCSRLGASGCVSTIRRAGFFAQGLIVSGYRRALLAVTHRGDLRVRGTLQQHARAPTVRAARRARCCTRANRRSSVCPSSRTRVPEWAVRYWRVPPHVGAVPLISLLSKSKYTTFVASSPACGPPPPRPHPRRRWRCWRRSPAHRRWRRRPREERVWAACERRRRTPGMRPPAALRSLDAWLSPHSYSPESENNRDGSGTERSPRRFTDLALRSLQAQAREAVGRHRRQRPALAVAFRIDKCSPLGAKLGDSSSRPCDSTRTVPLPRSCTATR